MSIKKINHLINVSNKSNSQKKEKEIKLAEYLQNKGYINGPEKFECGSKSFSIQKDSNNKNTGSIFRCAYNKCRKNIMLESILYLNYFHIIHYCCFLKYLPVYFPKNTMFLKQLNI